MTPVSSSGPTNAESNSFATFCPGTKSLSTKTTLCFCAARAGHFPNRRFYPKIAPKLEWTNDQTRKRPTSLSSKRGLLFNKFSDWIEVKDVGMLVTVLLHHRGNSRGFRDVGFGNRQWHDEDSARGLSQESSHRRRNILTTG